MKKMILIGVYALINFIVLLLCNQIQGTQNYVWITRYMNFETFMFCVFGVSFLFYWGGVYCLFQKRMSPKILFYIITSLSVIALFISSGITHGEALRSILFFDKNDVYMDFFNSIQYGMEPYKYKTIYPAFISALYGFIGQFVLIDKITEHAYYIRESQIGQVVFVTYSIFLYSIFFKLLFDLKDGSSSEKILVSVLLFFSVPFFFAMERGNSVMIALVAIMIFIRFYDSEERFWGIEYKYFAFIALGVATGIKISPAIYLLLLLREKKYVDTFKCLLILGVFFFIPFYFTDGNIFVLKRNLEYTVSLFQGFQISPDGDFVIIGHGAFVNLLNTFAFIGRLFNSNYINIATVLNYVVLVVGIFLVLICNNFKKYEICIILSGLMVLFPGFSAIYNLVYMAIPLVMFLNKKRCDYKKMEYLYSVLFILMFIPILNFRIAYFSVFYDDAYPLRLSTFLESFAILFLVLIVEFRGISSLLHSINLPRKMKISIVCLLVFNISFLLYCSDSIVGAVAVEKFYPSNMNVKMASKGFFMQDGEYKYIGNNASVILNKKRILDEGLIIRFAYDSIIDIDKITVLCNNQVIYNGQIHDKMGGLIFLDREKFFQFQDSEFFRITILINCNDGSKMFPISYIGPANPLRCINASTYLGESTGGLWKDNNTNDIYMGKRANIILQKSSMINGLVIKFSVDNKLLASDSGTLQTIKVFCNGNFIKECSVMKSGNSVILLQPYELSDFLQEVNCVEIEASNTYRTTQLEKNYIDAMYKSIAILYIGACDGMLELNSLYRNINKEWNGIYDDSFIFYGKKKYYLSMAELLNDDYEIIYEKSLYDANNFDSSANLKIFIDKEKIFDKQISYNHNKNLEAYGISKKYFKPYNYISEIEMECKNYETISSESTSGVRIKYFGSKQTNKEFSTKALENAYVRSEGLKWERNKKCFYFQDKAEILFDRNFFDGKSIIINYEVPEFLFQANPNQKMYLGIILNGEKIVDIPLNDSGKKEIVLNYDDYANAIYNSGDYVNFVLTTNCSYNLHSMRLAGKNNDYDVSLYLSYIGKENFE